MAQKNWHTVMESGALTLARRMPVRFDLAVVVMLPGGARGRIARQVRQDMWRALRTLRGFSPAVRVADCDGGLEITAGGQVDGPLPRAWAEARIAQVLNCPKNRARWQRWAA